MLAITPYPHITNTPELPCQGSNLDSSLSKREMLPITPQGIKARAEGFEPPSLQFRRLICYPVTLHSQSGLEGTRTPTAYKHLIYSQFPSPIWIPTQVCYHTIWGAITKSGESGSRTHNRKIILWLFSPKGLALRHKQFALPIATSPNSADGTWTPNARLKTWWLYLFAYSTTGEGTRIWT